MGFCQRRRQQFPSSHLLDVLVFLTKKGFMVWCLPVITKRFWLCPLFCCGLLAEVGDGCTEGMGSLYSTRNPSLSLTWLNCRLKGTYCGAKPGFNSCHPSPGFHSLSWAASHPPKVPFFFFLKIIFNLDQCMDFTQDPQPVTWEWLKVVPCSQLGKVHKSIWMGKRWRERSYICFINKKLRECVGCWEKSFSPFGEEQGRWGIGDDGGKQPFSTGMDYSLVLLAEVNHSPTTVFERLALGRDETLISHGQGQHPQALCNLSWKWILYPLCIPSTPPGWIPQEAARACAGKFP